MFSIGSYLIETPAALAPMAGITDKPFRQLARRFGAGYAVSEMLNSDPSLRHTQKSLHRSDFAGEEGIRAVQIVGSDPQRMAEAARYNAEQGAQIIDINMGCPAKKVCNVLAGSALLQNEKLVGDILTAVVAAAGVPVTLKTRLGFCENNKNIRTIAKMAEQAGIAALAVHGRTREQMYKGDASYELIAQVKQDISIPLWVNGDIASAEKAAAVLRQTGADGVMVGRGAQGRPWLFAEIKHFLQHGTPPAPIAFQTAADTFLQHLRAMYAFYGDTAGARIARKHIGWYTAPFAEGAALRKQANTLDNAAAQYDAVAAFLDTAPERRSGLWPSETANAANKI
ncbi:tRNA dihydrouridine synthase DusB [Neisseria sp. 23W00296]|uniref:tRNA dihydrouridine synthase DusB n=1 Tax=unclassified Neisseria TaxID=2623750 RepID=UPI0002A20BCC|nr:MULTISPECIES: tRNA dihydrouridine synthase DusB [unclassified Neisseria]ASP17378.1 tRNA dihydrouridine synthase DusB [Neisseria sp. KEM232]EKY04636.1 tRNA-dihydrouridine synthase B [Neisseria sp. oral taxon 020 str. F0370]